MGMISLWYLLEGTSKSPMWLTHPDGVSALTSISAGDAKRRHVSSLLLMSFCKAGQCLLKHGSRRNCLVIHECSSWASQRFPQNGTRAADMVDPRGRIS